MPPLTPAEKRAIADLQALAKRWPKTLWIHAGGTGFALNVLKVGDDGRPVIDERGAIDQRYLVGEATIPSDGSDW